MVITTLEAHVPADQWSALEQVAQAGQGRRPAQLRDSYLIQSTSDPTLWRLIGIWQSRAAFEEYRQSVEVPGGLQFFRSVGVEPTLTLFDVKG
jgi:quinol monooxygenase YgiN